MGLPRILRRVSLCGVGCREEGVGVEGRGVWACREEGVEDEGCGVRVVCGSDVSWGRAGMETKDVEE